jgi:GNAT superfamily N-acetyltransferase
MTLIRRAMPNEAAALRELAHRSKAYWPYDAAFLRAVAPMLILEPRHVASDEVHVLEVGGTAVGWHRVTFHGERAELEDLWLEPEWIGSGNGRTLFEHAMCVAEEGGATRLEWDAEPYAEGFYRAMGGVEIGRTPSAAEPGRTLPRMRLTVIRPPSGARAAASGVPAADAGPVEAP